MNNPILPPYNGLVKFNNTAIQIDTYSYGLTVDNTFTYKYDIPNILNITMPINIDVLDGIHDEIDEAYPNNINVPKDVLTKLIYEIQIQILIVNIYLIDHYQLESKHYDEDVIDEYEEHLRMEITAYNDILLIDIHYLFTGKYIDNVSLVNELLFNIDFDNLLTLPIYAVPNYLDYIREFILYMGEGSLLLLPVNINIVNNTVVSNIICANK